MNTEIREFIDKGADAPHPDLPYIERDAVTAVVRNSHNGTYLILRWKDVSWDTFITGGIEEGQTAEEAARAEVSEETGYTNLHLICELPRYDAKFFHGPKNVNRHAHFRCFLFELTGEATESPSEDELAKHEPMWLHESELTDAKLPEGHRYLFDYIQEHKL